jgi:hypothetical protein
MAIRSTDLLCFRMSSPGTGSPRGKTPVDFGPGARGSGPAGFFEMRASMLRIALLRSAEAVQFLSWNCGHRDRVHNQVIFFPGEMEPVPWDMARSTR